MTSEFPRMHSSTFMFPCFFSHEEERTRGWYLGYCRVVLVLGCIRQRSKQSWQPQAHGQRARGKEQAQTSS